jgi:hypothetical protein
MNPLCGGLKAMVETLANKVEAYSTTKIEVPKSQGNHGALHD